MKLRSQLLLLSLISLSLPWLGCQYIQEMDTVLRQSNREALTATANTIAATFHEKTEHYAALRALSSPFESVSIYANPIESPIILDGYDDDWLNVNKQVLYSVSRVSEKPDAGSKSHVIAAKKENTLWLLLYVNDDSARYVDPSQSIFASDYVSITIQSHDLQKRQLFITSSGPGASDVWLKKMHLDKGQTPEHSVKREYKSKAFRRETHNGYRIEIEFPFDWATNGLLLTTFDGPSESNKSTQSRSPTYSNTTDHTQLPPLSYVHPVLNRQLRVFQQKNLRLKIIDKENNTLAIAHEMTENPDVVNSDVSPPWLLAALYEFILDKHDANTPHHTESISIPLANTTNHAEGAFYLVLTPFNAASTAFAYEAFNRLMLYSMYILFFMGLLLLAYATWLAFRIAHLSKSAKHAISDSGKILIPFKTSRLNDEIGDVSRSFAALLSRLKEYTDYLKTMSSKLGHELRTPLAIVSSSLDNLELYPLDPAAKRYVQRARDGNDRLAKILEAMSSATRIEQLIQHSQLRPVEINTLLEELQSAYSDLYPNNSIRMVMETSQNNDADSGSVWIDGAPELLVQMLDKLLGNAVDFCFPGGEIQLAFRSTHNAVYITVSNEGPLLPNEMKHQLFDSMVSIRPGNTAGDKIGDRNTSTQPNTVHLGLGLHIVKLVVDFHHGTVQADNLATGNGVIFSVCFPTSNPS